MGAYLSEPVTNKISHDESGKNVAFGASSMQGWRVSQEDAHNTSIDFDKNVSLFAVYDGHGGHEVATYCASKLPDFIKQTDAYKRGDIRQALIDAFLGFDATLATPEVIKILKEISGNHAPSKDKDGNSIDLDEEDNVSNLKREAEMPLEQVIAKYQSENSQFKSDKFGKRLGAGVSSPYSRCRRVRDDENLSDIKQDAKTSLEQEMTKFQAENSRCNSEKKLGENIPASPYLRCRRARDKAGGSSSSSSSSSSGAGCSSSSSWNTNESDVSSSSQPCGSSTVGKSENVAAATVTTDVNATDTATATTSVSASVVDDNKKSDSPGSSETDQILDSTTSNGEITHECAVKGSTKTAQSSKTIDMPDSSEDVADQVAPSKSIVAEETSSTATDINGSTLKEKVADAECSIGDNVSSSSTMENGEITQQEGISSSSRRASSKTGFYGNFWDKSLDANDGDDDDDEDDEDENDESYDVVAHSASDDDDGEDIDDDDDDDDSSDLDDDGEEEDDDDDDDLGEDDDDMDEDNDDDDNGDFTIHEEPGSDSGCTAVVAILSGNDLYVANAGDSRCVLCRDGKALALSLDHKPEDEPEMERIVKAGGKVTADGRVNGGLNLSRALGDHAYKQNAELPPEDQMISALPDVRHITIDPERDEFMVLACDGVWNFMMNTDVISFVKSRINTVENLSKICEELFDLCLAPNTMGDGTGCDNMTAIIVRFKPFKSVSENNKAEDNNVAEVKKRPLSPSTPDETITIEKTVDECKRAKIETV